MYRFTLFAMAVGLTGLLTTGFGAHAQSPGTTQQSKAGDPQTKRLAYVVQHGSAKDLATVLGKHFKGDADFEAGPEAASNMLLINAKAEVFNEVVTMLNKLDRRPQVVAVEIIVLDIVSKKGADGKAEAGGVDEKQLSGPADRVLGYVKKLQSQATSTNHKDYRLVTLENQATRLAARGSKPYITGSVTMAVKDGKSRTTNSIAYRDTGTQLTVTPVVGSDEVITLNVQFEDSRMLPSENGIALGTDDKGQPVLATEFPMVSYSATLSLKSGQAILAKDVQTTSKMDSVKTLMVVTAHVLP